MVDISKVIEAKSDQLNAADLMGRDLVIKIREVRYHPDKTEQPLEFFYEGDNGKPWRLSKAAARIVTHFWGTETDVYIGRRLALYNDDSVTFGGQKVGGIRIKAMSDIKEKSRVRVPTSRGKYKDYEIDVLRMIEPKPAAPQVTDWLAFVKDVLTNINAAQSNEEIDAAMKIHAASIKALKAADLELYEQIRQGVESKRASLGS